MSPKGCQKKVSAYGLIPVCGGAYIHYFKIIPHFLLSSLFWKSTQPLGQDQQNSKQTYCRLSIIVFLWTPKGFISPESLVAEKFQIFSVKTTANTFVSQKVESVQFYSCPQAKLSPRFWSLSPRQTGISHSTRTAFSEDIFSWAERGGEDYVVKKITKINKCVGHKFW